MLLGRRAKRKNAQPGVLRMKTALSTLAVFLFAIFVVARSAHAASPLTLDVNIAKTIGLSTTDIRTMVGLIIKSFLTLLGLLAVVLMMYAGFLWMTAQGKPEQLETAKKIMTNAVIGLLIIVSAYGIVLMILNFLGVGNSGASVSSSGSSSVQQTFSSNPTGSILGNGIISYVYPEPAQQDVPRNTKISITFKKPVALSTVIADYDDNGTYTTSDDLLCPGAPPCRGVNGEPTGTPVTSATTFQLNTDNVKLIANSDLQPGGTGTLDAQFAARYPNDKTLASTPPVARFTVTLEPLTATQDQSLVFKPVDPIGSPTDDVNYRVALRGGDNGVKVWTMPTTGTTPIEEDAFPRAYADGGYYWPFTTNTVIDLTPPKIVAVEPFATPVPGTPPSTVLARNQLLQVYFDKAIDPTSSTGDTALGFDNIKFIATCEAGMFTAGTCTFNGGVAGSVSGTVAIGNRYQTLEFTPTADCSDAGVSENSCGDKVYCLPKNVDLSVSALAASVGTASGAGPTAIAENGITDMADNSLDGNGDGVAEGPTLNAQTQPNGRPNDYNLNNPPDAVALLNASDTADWQYVIGDNVDLVVPTITALDPPAPPPPDVSYSAGPSEVPVDLNPSITWSKVMSISSMLTGAYDELSGQYTPGNATLALRSHQCAKTNPSVACPIPTLTNAAIPPCPCTELDPPGFFVGANAPTEAADYSIISFMHPGSPFYTANDLGYTDADIANYPQNLPVIAPIARAEIRDTTQNCFWPSMYTQCATQGSSTGGVTDTSCCDETVGPDGGFLTTCSPTE
jgi:hypothetical protein